MEKLSADIGVVGLAVMGSNLALNLADKGLRVGLWNLEPGVAANFASAHAGGSFVAASTLGELVATLKAPRIVLLMIRAGAPVDDVIAELTPLLGPGDVIVDGGNSRYQDSHRRGKALAAAGVHFLGMGVSGGAEGARTGPSLMPGGDLRAWEACRSVLQSIAAHSRDGACVGYVGKGGAGHFVKMVHNGIEYGDMQLIAETYDLLRKPGGLSAPAIAEVFQRFQEGPLESFLIELTAEVLRVPTVDGHGWLVDDVADSAGQKGTGRWTVLAAMELGVAVPTLTAAVDARLLSAQRLLRQRVGGYVRPSPGVTGPIEWSLKLEQALLLSKLCAYTQGFALMAEASRCYDWGIALAEVARLWTGGCIIRARLLADIREAFLAEPELPSLLLAPAFRAHVADCLPALRDVVASAAQYGVPVPTFGASLAYLDALGAERLPQNLTQAQRDAFGAHTYHLSADLEGPAQHTDWLALARAARGR